MATKIQLRRDSEANWTGANPVLAEGEVGVNLDNNGFKIGDGVKDWATLPYAQDINSLETYLSKVDTSPQDVAGDITLGTDKITLNATDGSAEFSGQMEIGNDLSTASGTRIYKNGALHLRHDDPDDGANVFKIYRNGFADADEVVRFTASGSALFAGGDIKLNADGSAQFEGTVDVTYKASGINSYTGFFSRCTAAAPPSTSVQGSALYYNQLVISATSASPGSAPVFRTFLTDDGTEKIALNADGSGSFAGTLTTSGGAGGPYVTIGQTIGFNLEADNPDNYTTTTEEYEDTIRVPIIGGIASADLVDGEPQPFEEKTITRTREIKTYTGPVLDVKAELQALQARATEQDEYIAQMKAAMKAAGIDIDGATPEA